MKRNIIVIVLLAGLITWGLLDLRGEDTTITANEEQLVQTDTDRSDQTLPETEEADVETEKTAEEKPKEEVVVGLQQGNYAPDFELETLDGELVKLSDFYGQKVILNLWASWCPPCRAEMPHMQDFYEKHKQDGITILAVNLTTLERNTADIVPFVEEEFQLTFPILLDVDGEIGHIYQAYSIPTTYIIDTSGRIQHKVIGPMSYEMMENFKNNID
ncbi:peroxiredoxin family protein [Alkalihalobacterium elongatum]|uniref:peroxiredoxin family protein n=1 Tax=Alkalihalobacterium elongatum TaxID=2675466 RepID=UPI001C1FFABD|nr:TlpA disulfide reductase family protein [Alkalihalobacterium elongatum]